MQDCSRVGWEQEGGGWDFDHPLGPYFWAACGIHGCLKLPLKSVVYLSRPVGTAVILILETALIVLWKLLKERIVAVGCKI